MTNCLKSPALFPLLIPAVLNSNTLPFWPNFCWRGKTWSQPQNNLPLLGNVCCTCSILAQVNPWLRVLTL